MKRFILLEIIILFVIASCGGGGGASGGGSSSSSSGGNNNQSGSYSVNLNRQSITIDIPFGGSAGPDIDPQTVIATFEGDGVIVGYPPDVTPDDSIMVTVISETSNTVTFSINLWPGTRFEQVHEYSTILRFVSGNASGTNVVYEDLVVTVRQLDGFEVWNTSDNEFGGEWGSEGALTFEVNTFGKSWEVESDFAGFDISPVSGSGAQTISVSYLPEYTPVGNYTATLTFTANSGEQIEQDIQFEFEAPQLVNTDTVVIFPKGVPGESLAPIDLEVSFSNGVQVPWQVELSPWLSANTTQGTSGLNALAIYVDSENFPETSELLQGTATVTYDIPGVESLSRTFDVSYAYEPFYYQASPATFAFSDYGPSSIQQGSIELNAAILEESVESLISWLIIDEVAGKNIEFHIDPSTLPTGYSEAQIQIGNTSTNGFIGTQVNVGYYKSDSATVYGDAGTWLRDAFAVTDKLGPWVYIGRALDSQWNSIVKYNYHTRTIEDTLTIEEVSDIGALAVSDDGKTLYGLSYLWDSYQGVLIKVDLATFSSYTTVNIDGPQSPEYMRAATFSGKQMVSDGSHWFTADTGGDEVYRSGDTGYSDYVKSGVFRVYQNNGSGFEFERYDYSYLTNTITETQITTFSTSGPYGEVNLSPNDQWLVGSTDYGLSADRVARYRLSLSEDNIPVITEQGELDLGDLNESPVARVNSDGAVAIMAYFFDPAEGISERSIRLYDAQLEEINTFIYEEYFGLSWFFFTADEKTVSYLVKNTDYTTSTMYIQSVND